MIKCLLSRPGLISGPLKLETKLILSEFQGLTLLTPSLVLYYIYHLTEREEGAQVVNMH